MLKTGKLAPDTLVAEDGGAAWMTLRQLYEQHRHTAPCPHCNRGVAPEAGTTPPLMPLICPHCSTQLRPVCPQNFFSNIAFTLKNIFRFRGRATRREFWSAVLGCILGIPMVLCIVHLFVALCIEGGVQVQILIGISVLAICAILAMVIHMAAISTRRLRDAGMSLKPVWGLLGYPLSIALTFVADDLYSHADHSLAFLHSIACCLCFISFVCTMIIGVLALAPSKHPS